MFPGGEWTLIGFVDMSQQGGLFMVWWDDQLATTPFTVAH